MDGHTLPQIVSVAGVGVKTGTVQEVQSLLRANAPECVVEIQKNPDGFAFYERKLGRARPELKFSGARAAELEDEMDDLMGDMLNLSHDLSFTAPVRLVGGKVSAECSCIPHCCCQDPYTALAPVAVVHLQPIRAHTFEFEVQRMLLLGML